MDATKSPTATSPKAKKAPKPKKLKVLSLESKSKAPKDKTEKPKAPVEIPAELKPYFALPKISGMTLFNKTLLSKRKTERTKTIIAFFIAKVLPLIQTYGMDEFIKITKGIARLSNDKKVDANEALQHVQAYIDGGCQPLPDDDEDEDCEDGDE